VWERVRDGWSCQGIQFDEMGCLIGYLKVRASFGSAVRKRISYRVAPGFSGEANMLHFTWLAGEVIYNLYDFLAFLILSNSHFWFRGSESIVWRNDHSRGMKKVPLETWRDQAADSMLSLLLCKRWDFALISDAFENLFLVLRSRISSIYFSFEQLIQRKHRSRGQQWCATKTNQNPKW